MPPRRTPLAIVPTGSLRWSAATDAGRAAVTLLTRVPVGAPAAATTGAAAFPFVGAILGAVGALPLLLLPARDGPIAAIAVLAIVVVLTGALHLDGLADSADALAAPDPAGAERARTDPRIGAAGATAVILVLGLDAACLALLAGSDRGFAALAVITGVVAGRGAVAVMAPWLPRREAGSGAWFGAGTSREAAGIAGLGLVAVTLVAALLARSATPVLTGAVGFSASGVALIALARRQGGATGDAYGAAIELGLAAGLLGAALLRP